MWNPNVTAARGAEYLDTNHPGWYRKVRITDLDMSNSKVCILGFCFGDYWEALAKITSKPIFRASDNDERWAVTHGFNVPAFLQMQGGYERLALSWLPLIRERRKARKQVK